MKLQITTCRLLLLVALFFNATFVFAQKPLKRPPKPNTSTSTTTKKPSQSTSTKKPSSGAATSSKPKTTISSPTGYINGYGYVDLGLSVKWATCNVGASSPEGYGNYYAWGETSTKPSYDVDNSRTYNVSMGSIAGNSSYDAARANWGGTWRLPTWSEIDELVDKCTRTWTTINGHTGYKVTGPNGNSIFLSAAGCRYGASLGDAGESGYYWSATPNEDGTNSAYNLSFDSGNFGRGWSTRYGGQTVRPVSE